MAIAGYKFDQDAKRNQATSDIQSDLDQLGIPLDQRTILKWLREACEIIPKNRKNLALAQPFGRLPTSALFLRSHKMGRRANPMAVKSSLTYEVDELQPRWASHPPRSATGSKMACP